MIKTGLLLLSLTLTAHAAETETTAPLQIDLFIASKQPASHHAMHLLTQIAAPLAPRVKIDLKYAVHPDGDSWTSPLGNEELQEDVRQLIVLNYYRAHFWDYTNCRIAKPEKNAWKKCLARAQIPKAKFKALVEKQGDALLKKHAAYTRDKRITQVPGIFIAGQRYMGQVHETSLRREILKSIPIEITIHAEESGARAEDLAVTAKLLKTFPLGTTFKIKRSLTHDPAEGPTYLLKKDSVSFRPWLDEYKKKYALQERSGYFLLNP